MSETPLPQYASSTDPAVIAAIKCNLDFEQAFRAQVCDLSEKYTGSRERAWVSSAGDGSVLLGVHVPRAEIDDLPGDWTLSDLPKYTRPHKKNPRHAEFDIRAEHTSIPGRPDIVFGDGWLGCGAVFVHDDTAWSGFTFAPTDVTDFADHGWTEVLASQFQAALNAVNG